MTSTKYIDSDIVRVYRFGKKRVKKNLLATLFWGDEVRVIERVGKYWKLDFPPKRIWNKKTRQYEWKPNEGSISAKTRFRADPILKIRFIDVGQGDASIIESPKGKLVLLDGGEENYLRYYVSTAWMHVLRKNQLVCDAMIVTHGDADHFAGLTKLLKAKRFDPGGRWEPMIDVQRVYHNGLVKAPSKVKDVEKFGKTKLYKKRRYVVDLEDDPRTVSDARLNKFFIAWKKELNNLTIRNPNLDVRRLAYGDQHVFDFLSDEGIDVEVLGPIVEKVDGTPALPFLHSGGGGISASHTVNGHSVVLRLKYGKIHVLFGADLNKESEAGLLERIQTDSVSLTSEVLKVPHHGSADFTPRMLEAVRPVVSVISSGDESESKEYIHPRAGLVGALGKYSRSSVDKPLIYVTEMVAFFDRVGLARIRKLTKNREESKKEIEDPNVYIKKQFGIVHVRTDGERVLVATHSGKPGFKESYAFKVDGQGKISFEEKTSSV
jgi:hypothetical protein